MSKPFSFANLVGGGTRPRAEAEDKEEDQDATAKAEEEEAEYEDKDEDAAEAEEDTARAAVLAERGRIAAILALATPDTVAQAAALATQTDLTVDQAKMVLAAAPKPAGGLAAAMRGRAAAPVAQAPDTASASDLPAELKAAQARRIQAKER